MSTKTIYKRIALVAVAALGAGVLSVAPANAAGTATIDVTAAILGVSDTPAALATATGITGNQVIFTYGENVGTGEKLYINTTGGTIVSAADTANAGAIVATGTSIANGATWTTAAGDTTGTFAVTSAAAGTQVVGIQSLSTSTGLYTTVAALTITWVAATSTDLGSVAGYTQAIGTTCDGTVAATTIGSVGYLDGTGIELCVVLKNAAGSAYTRSTAISVVGNGIGKVNDNAVAATASVTAGYQEYVIKGNALSGKASFTVTATTTNADGTTVNTKTTVVPVISNGDFTTITLANVKSSIAASTATEAIDYSATDKDGQAASTAGGSAIQWYIQSDKGTAAITATAPNNSSASVSSVTDDGITAATGASSDAGRATVTAGADYEKLTVWVTKKNAAGATITSNKVTVYVSTTTAKTVTVAAAKVATGGYTVTVTALSDPLVTGTAYPVIDGETVTLGASAGILSATSLATGKTGNAVFTYYEPQLSGTVLMTAGADLAVGTASLVVANGALDGITTLVNSLIAKINALNKLVIKIQKKVRA